MWFRCIQDAALKQAYENILLKWISSLTTFTAVVLEADVSAQLKSQYFAAQARNEGQEKKTIRLLALIDTDFKYFVIESWVRSSL